MATVTLLLNGDTAVRVERIAAAWKLGKASIGILLSMCGDDTRLIVEYADQERRELDFKLIRKALASC